MDYLAPDVTGYAGNLAPRNNQYVHNNQISNMDYWSLAAMLMNNISPQIRKQILARLTEMNEQLMPTFGSYDNTQPDLSRTGSISSRKKDQDEIPHPSLNFLNYNGQNPLPLPIPLNGNTFNMNPYQMPTNTPLTPMNNQPNYAMPCPTKQISGEIDIDDIIDDIHNEHDDLDEKLNKIKKLHTKIIADKRRRRRQREHN